MKKTIFIILSFLVLNGYSQQNSVKPLGDRALQTIEKRNEYVKKYADSLNLFNYDKDEKIPTFFYRYNFDREHSQYRTSMNDETSFRKLIIDKVTNIELLRAVLQCRDKRLRKINKKSKKNMFGVKAFQNYSTYDLVQYRVEELINENHSGTKK